MGDLGEGAAFEQLRQDHGALGVGELRERRAERPCGGGSVVALGRRQVGELDGAPGATRLVGEAPPRHGVEPRERRLGAVEARGGIREDALGQLLGRVVVACSAAQIAVDVAVVAAERCFGASGHTRHVARGA